MSSRQLRRLQQQRELEKTRASAVEESEESEDGEGTAAPPRPRPNLFAALGGEDEDASQDEDADRDEGGEDQAEQDLSQLQPKESNSENKRKKKKKKKKKKKTKTAAADADGNEQGGAEQDEIDKALRELRVDPKPSDVASTPEPTSRMSELLGIDTYHLRAVNEIKNLFGREVIESANAEEQQASGRRRRAPLQQQVDLETFLREPPGAPKLSDVSLRRNPFVQGRDHWPRKSAGGLTMREVERAPDGSWAEYAYVHDKDYDGVQAFFFACVQIGDPMRMVYLLKQYPYHVSTLLQVSSVAKQDQNMALSAELCERALFSFGRVTTALFRQDMERGRARLDFRRPENRQFWLAGYHYLKSLIRRGTYRTALEWAKLLYALDPRDPYAIRHYIHLLAVRAHESRWLVDFLADLDQQGDIRDVAYLRQTLVLAKLQMGDVEGARRQLRRGVERLPWLYCALFQELNLDAPPSIWGIGPDSDARSFWVKLYLYQAKELWNNAQATALLLDVTKSMGRVDVAALPGHDAPVDLGATRLAYLEGETSLLAAAPRELLESQPNYDFDPLPPPEQDNVFSTAGTQMPWHDRRLHDGAHDPELLARIRNLMARHGELAPRGGMLGLDDEADDDEDDDEVRALRRADDEELQRDLEAHLAAGPDEPGLLAAVMQMLGIGGDGVDGTLGRDGGGGPFDWDDGDGPVDGDGGDGAGAYEPDGLPGAWPVEEEDGDGAAGGRRG